MPPSRHYSNAQHGPGEAPSQRPLGNNPDAAPCLEKAMANHFRILALRTPSTV